MNAALTTDSDARKDVPLARGCLDYFPAALAEVARLSKVGNDKHNPGEDMHHARGKSSDHADCILRHLTDRGIVDTDGFLHDVKVAWRALAMLQEALEAAGVPVARGARLPKTNTFKVVGPPGGGWVCVCGSTTPGVENKLSEIYDPTDTTVVCDNPNCCVSMKWFAR